MYEIAPSITLYSLYTEWWNCSDQRKGALSASSLVAFRCQSMFIIPINEQCELHGTSLTVVLWTLWHIFFTVTFYDDTSTYFFSLLHDLPVKLFLWKIINNWSKLRLYYSFVKSFAFTIDLTLLKLAVQEWILVFMI